MAYTTYFCWRKAKTAERVREKAWTASQPSRAVVYPSLLSSDAPGTTSEGREIGPAYNIYWRVVPMTLSYFPHTLYNAELATRVQLPYRTVRTPRSPSRKVIVPLGGRMRALGGLHRELDPWLDRTSRKVVYVSTIVYSTTHVLV